MSVLIDKQTAIDALDKQIRQCDRALASFDIAMRDEYAVKVEKASLVAFRETLDYLPSAQPEIIRCGECRHRGDVSRKDPAVFKCRHNALWVSAEEFCSDGERNKDEDE